MQKHYKNTSGLRRLLTAGSIIATIAALGSVILPHSVRAACSVPGTNYGTATMQLSVATAGTYKLWTHMNAPDTANNSVLMEVDGGSCFTVGNSDITANAWTWVNHQNGTMSSKITTSLTAGNHTIKLIGNEASVKVDRVLAVADQNCTPSGQGDNCMVTADTTKPTVSITSPADNSTVSGSTTIKVTASDANGISKVEFSADNNLVSTDTSAPYEYSWDVSNLSNGTHTISVKAYDAAGNSATDTQVVTVQNGDAQAPSTPTNVKATADSYNKISLSWTASTDNVAVTGYRVVRNNTTIATVTSTSYTDVNVVAGTKYSYYVVALDGSNNVSANSTTVSVTTPTPTTADTQAPSKPSSLTATASSTSQINVAWKPSTDNIGVKEYDLYRAQGSNAGSKIATTSNTSYGDGGLSSGTTYSYYVIARDAAGNTSQASDTASATTSTPQQEPQGGTSTLRGSVQGRNGRAISGAKVTIWVNDKRYQTTTNWRGNYILTGIPSGRYDVSYRASNYDRKTLTVRLTAGKTKWQDVTLRRN